MKTVTKSFSSGSVVTKSDLPPVHTTLKTHLFSKTASLNEAGTHALNTKGTGCPVVARLCGNIKVEGTIEMTDLSGVTIVGFEGTSTPSIVGNEIKLTIGTAWYLELSDGTKFYFERGVLNCSDAGQAVVSFDGIDWVALEYSSGAYSYNLNEGFDRYGKTIPVQANTTVYFGKNGELVYSDEGFGVAGTTDGEGKLTVGIKFLELEPVTEIQLEPYFEDSEDYFYD